MAGPRPLVSRKFANLGPRGNVGPMAGPRYPLETLRQLRDDRAEAQTHALAAQVARSQVAEAKLREREAARREHGERTAEVLRLERERLVLGVRGADLLRLTDFEAAAKAQAGLLERAEAEARSALSQEREREQQLRLELAALEADAELVRRHEASFQEGHAQRREKAEEEAALEQWSARRH